MYDTSASCSYLSVGTNEQYQSELLKVFQIKDADDLNECITVLYERVKSEPTLPSLVNKVMEMYPWANSEHAFYVLFSYDYFEYTHPYVVNVLNHVSIDEVYEKLLSEIK
jgi:hypothetical protein